MPQVRKTIQIVDKGKVRFIQINHGVTLGLAANVGTLVVQYVFAVSNAFLLLLAGSLASQLAKVLTQADWVGVGSEALWDTSTTLPQDSPPGMLLHALVGYDASPSGLQLGFYLLAIGFIWLASRWVQAGLSPQGRPVLRSP